MGKKVKEGNSDTKKITTVGQWILEKINTKDWRGGKGTGFKHYKRSSKGSSNGNDNIQEMIETVGREKFLKQVRELEKVGIISVVYTNVNCEVKEIIFPLKNADVLFEYEKMENPRKIIAERKEFLKKQMEMVSEQWLLNYYEHLYGQLENGNYKDVNMKLEKDKRDKLEKLDVGELEELKQCILKYGLEFEQENLI